MNIINIISIIINLINIISVNIIISSIIFCIIIINNMITKTISIIINIINIIIDIIDNIIISIIINVESMVMGAGSGGPITPKIRYRGLGFRGQASPSVWCLGQEVNVHMMTEKESRSR